MCDGAIVSRYFGVITTKHLFMQAGSGLLLSIALFAIYTQRAYQATRGEISLDQDFWLAEDS